MSYIEPQTTLVSKLDSWLRKTPVETGDDSYTVEPTDVTDEDTDTDSIQPIYTPNDDPVSVKIVTSDPTIVVERGSLTWGSQKTIVTDQPQLIVGRDKRRRSVTLRNHSDVPIALNSAPNVKLGVGAAGTNYGSGELRVADGSLKLETCGDIWAIAGAGLTSEVSIFQVLDDGQ